jgi:tetraacyldisaccharide 4'-kinase
VLRVLFVANGHGETAIAACIAEHVVALAGAPVALDLFPLVGTGAGAEPLALVGPRAVMPSGGLVAMGNVRAFARDVRAGFFALFARQVAFLGDVRGRYDAVVAVGDVFALALALRARERTLFVGTAKSVYVAPYGRFERGLLRRASRAFVRDEPTAAHLRREGVAAEAPGNVIVDMVQPGVAPAGAWLGVLPGSRGEAYADAVRLARVARALGPRRPELGALMSIAPTVDAARLARALGDDGWTIEPGEGFAPFRAHAELTRLVAWRGPLGALLDASVAVLGQAGTANEQAAAYGVPVVALRGPSARREDWYRMRQRRLLGDALLLVPPEPGLAASAIDALLGDAASLRRMRTAGPERMGPRGGAATIARAIVEAAA